MPQTSLSKRILRWGITVLVVGGGYVIIVNQFSYVRLFPYCSISISADYLSGNRATIFAAIAHLKERDRDAYRTLCRYVDEIIEKYCVGSDWHIENPPRGYAEPGCYVRGSQTILLRPEAGESVDIIRTRADALKKYAGMSKKFWEGK